jgi:hypothetical protein
MSGYKYLITRTDEELSVSIEVDNPLPHLAVGNTLTLGNKHVGSSGDSHFVIRHVETILNAFEPPAARLVHTVIYIAPQERKF